MTLQLGVLQLIRSLSADRSERRRLGAAVARLLRQRRRSLSALGQLLRVAPTGGKAKLLLWQTLARSRAAHRLQGTSPEATSEVVEAIRFVLSAPLSSTTFSADTVSPCALSALPAAVIFVRCRSCY